MIISNPDKCTARDSCALDFANIRIYQGHRFLLLEDDEGVVRKLFDVQTVPEEQDVRDLKEIEK